MPVNKAALLLFAGLYTLAKLAGSMGAPLPSDTHSASSSSSQSADRDRLNFFKDSGGGESPAATAALYVVFSPCVYAVFSSL